MKKRILLIGPTQAGKSTLANLLNGTDRPLRKTQDVIYGRAAMDTPGSYIENAWMYRYLIATAQTASAIVLLVDQTRPVEVYPPGFAKAFTCPVYGAVTKTDAMTEHAALCAAQLRRSGACEPYFWLSVSDPAGLAQFKATLLRT